MLTPDKLRARLSGQTRVEIVADSIIGSSGPRLTTIQISGFWKLLLQELERHRVFSLCVGSSRAVPGKKFREQVLKDPFIPLQWGSLQKGMQAGAELTGWRFLVSFYAWMLVRYAAVLASLIMERVGLHKQVSNRILEPWMKIDLVLSATEWINFLSLRDHKDAQPEFQAVAKMIYEAIHESIPTQLYDGQWHLPFVNQADVLNAVEIGGDVRNVSAARCARASYLQWNGKTYKDDADLVKRLIGSVPRHLSPFEHVAQVSTDRERRSGNFTGFIQWRETLQPTMAEIESEYFKRKSFEPCLECPTPLQCAPGNASFYCSGCEDRVRPCEDHYSTCGKSSEEL